VIFAKLWMFDNVNTSVLTDCTLVAGSDSDESRTMLEGNSGVVVAGATVALQVTHVFAAAGGVALNCNGFGVNISINNIKITAIKVANLTNTGL
jgi:stage V sporulation protein SpoVS